ncbi:MAG: hypothetical protein WBV82_20660 [Myxococcaceae bacterium]
MPNQNLTAVLSNPESRRAMAKDAEVMLDEEVASRGGLTGMGIKTAFAMVKAIRPGFIGEVLNDLLPEFGAALDPLLAKRPDSGSPGLAAWLEQRPAEVANALLGVTDTRARRTSHKTLLSAYNKLRPIAEKQVSQSVPRLAKLVERHVS